MPQLLRNVPALRDSIDYLLEHDRVLSASGLTRDDVTATRHEFTFPALIKAIVGQQLSVKAAATIWGRVTAGVDIHDPRAVFNMPADDLRAMGLSFSKIKYVQGVAAAVVDERLDLQALARADNDTVITALTSLKGFGVWSAQMVLIFALARPDVWPAGDLGVQSGLQIYRRLKERPDQKATAAYGARKFGEHSSAAALLLWRLKDRAAQKQGD